MPSRIFPSLRRRRTRMEIRERRPRRFESIGLVKGSETVFAAILEPYVGAFSFISSFIKYTESVPRCQY
jgi:hypothetical protein